MSGPTSVESAQPASGSPASTPTTSAKADDRPLLERLAPTAIRGAWFALAIPGLLVGRALTGRSTPVAVTGNALWWLLWGAGLVAVLVWHPIGLVGLRTAAPAAFVVTAWAARSASDEPIALRTAAVAIAALAVVLAIWNETGHLCVNGPAYPNERRFLLRPAAALAFGPLPIAGALVSASAIVGPMLLAARQWIGGAIALAAGAGVLFVLPKALYAQARRFVVFVPAGFVLHDEFVLREPVLFVRRVVEGIAPAAADSDSLDLTNNAAGLAIEVLLTEKTEVVRVVSRTNSEVGKTARFLFVPTLPGRLLDEARRRRLTR